MKKYLFRTNSGSRKLLVTLLLFISFSGFAWEGMPMSRLHVEGRYLKDPHGNIVNLHGFAQTYSPWFNEEGRQWSNYDVAACLKYNKGIIDGIMKAGWKVNFIRLHMDPYWSNNPGVQVTGENDISAFNLIRFKSYLNSVFVPMAEYAISKGLYVIMRPPGVCPEKIAVGDAYNTYLKKVWGTVSLHAKLKNNPYIMFELANEPVNILGTDGTYGAGSQGHFDNLKTYFQSVVDTIRTNADNILWVPGLGYQSLYSGYAANPIQGENIGYAVHVYPGWFNSGQGYAAFQRGWDSQVKPVADFAPVVVTEMDWAPAKYNKSWGKDVTGVAGGDGFGANFQKITDKSGNVSWLIFTGPDLLAKFTGVPLVEGEEPTFYNDPEACPWPTYHWYQEYTKVNYARPDFVNISTKDNGDATFANPILSADFPDPILVQSGNTYYLVSTNQNRFPSTTILESKDLVNWQYSSQPIDSIPLESKILVDETNIQAGTMVTVGKEQWAIVSYDNGLLGKFPYLLPVTMVDGKPVVDVTAKVSLKIKKPKVGRGYIATYLPTNDAFRHYKLGSQWAWNKKPDNTKWSLVERAGYMRLKTGAVADSLHHAQNIMTQRVLSYKNDTVLSYGTIWMEIKGMKDGDVAGLSVSKNKYGYIGVAMNNGEKKLVTCVNNEMQTGPVVSDTVIYLRGVVNDTTKIAEFYYSFNETTFTKLGGNLTMDQELPQAGGCLFGLFNYATASEGGYVDVDWFSTEPSYDESFYYAENNTVNYTIQSLTLTDIKVTGGDSLTYLANSSSNLIVKATYADGHTEDISSACRYESLNPDVVDINRGAIVTRKDGEATVNISFTGPLGEQKVVTVHISSEIFPLVKKLFNPSIYATGNFYDKIKTLRTGQWGFGGWVYKNGIDLSGYKYLVFKFYSVAYCGASLRIFDENNYWSGAAQYDFGSNKQVVVNLESMVKSGTTTKVDPSHLYMIGLWSDGSSNIVISDVYVTNNDDYSKMNGIEDVQDNLLDENEPVDVYSVMGVKIRSNVLRKDATLNLPEGMYIVGNQKVMVLKQ